MSDQPTPWSIRRGSSIGYWEVSASEENVFPGTPATCADLDYRFISGVPEAIGDLPCRRAFRATMVGRSIPYPQRFSIDELRLSADTPRVDYSDFWFLPTHVRRHARCTLISDDDSEARFLLSTCGSAIIWVNGELAARFEPFQRNQRQSAEVTLPLRRGINEVMVHFEELCERDTNWHFELQLASDVALGLGLVTPIDASRLRELQGLLDSARLNRCFYGDEPVVLLLDEPVAQPVTIDATVRGGHGDKATGFATSIMLNANQSAYELFHGAQAPAGCATITLSIPFHGSRVERTIGATFLASIAPGEGDTITERKQLTGQRLLSSRRGGAARALLHLHHGVDLGQARDLMLLAIDTVEQRFDCADFDLVPLLWAWHDHHGRHLGSTFWSRLRTAILEFRYWVDEPGNDVMWFWSENHVLCFHASQYLAGQLFPNDRFTASGRTGAEQHTIAADRLRRWFAAVEKNGFVEWNSAAYYPIDFIGLLALEQLAADDDIKQLAKFQLDRLFAMIALHTQRGIPTGSMGRAYEKELFAAQSTELATFAHIAWGGGWVGAGVKSAPMFCVSDYEPPEITSVFTRATHNTPIQASYTQGVDHLAQLALWKDGEAQLSTVIGNSPGARGHQQHVIDAQLAGDPRARFWINRPGDHRPWGSLRPSYWAGSSVLPNVAQYENLALVVFGPTDLLGEDLPNYTHLFAPAEVCDELATDEHWLFARVGHGFVAIFASGGLHQQQDGLYAGTEWRCLAPAAGWLVGLGNRHRDGSFDAFRNRWQTAALAFDAQAAALTLQSEHQTFQLSATGELLVDGKPNPNKHRDVVPQVAMGHDTPRPWPEITMRQSA